MSVPQTPATWTFRSTSPSPGSRGSHSRTARPPVPAATLLNASIPAFLDELLRFDSSVLGHVDPALGLVLDQLGKVFRTGCCGKKSQILEALLDLRAGHDFDDIVGNLLSDLIGRTGR